MNFFCSKLKGDYKRLYREKWEYYGGKSDAKIYASKPFDLKVLKTDLGVYISADEEIIDAENKIGYLETVVDYIKGVIKSIDNRGWDIKNAIEWKKFEKYIGYYKNRSNILMICDIYDNVLENQSEPFFNYIDMEMKEITWKYDYRSHKDGVNKHWPSNFMWT